MVLNLKFQAVPKGVDAVYVYVPGLIDSFYIRPDWKDANYIIMAAITYLGSRAEKRKLETGKKEQVVISCNLTDFIFEPFPLATLTNLEEVTEKRVIPFTRKQRKA